MHTLIDIFINNRHLQDLNPLIVGMEQCLPGHSFGPAIRPYTLIHFVMKGKGTLYKRGKEYPVHAGDAFLILPDEITTYTADMDDPWHYQWIGFDGSLAKDFAQLPPVFPVSERIFRRLRYDMENTGTLEYKYTAGLFDLYAEVFSQQPKKKQYVQQVQDYIQANYMQKLSVEELAKRINLDRRYLSRLFKEQTCLTIQEYIISIRMKEAQHYLNEGYSVKECAMLCGYDDVSNFSKMFKRTFGCSPAFYE